MLLNIKQKPIHYQIFQHQIQIFLQEVSLTQHIDVAITNPPMHDPT